MARVTLITPYFWPEVTASVPLMTSLSEDLVAYGHAVTVVTSLPSRNVDPEVREDFHLRRKMPETYHGARVIRYPNPFSSRKGRMAKILEGLLFWVWAAYAALLLRRETDVFFVSSTPPLLSLPVSLFSNSVPILYNLQDVFPDSMVSSRRSDSGIMLKILRYLEKRSYERSTIVTAVGESLADHVARCSPGVRVEVIPNWVDTADIDRVPKENNALLASLGRGEAFTVLYAGNMGFAQNLDVVVETADLLRNRPEIQFVLVGDGQYKEAIAEKVSRLRLKNVAMLPMQPQNRVPEVYSMGDVGIVTVRSGLEHTCVPSKTWSIMACRCPVVACVGPNCDLSRLLESRDLGLVVPPDEPRELASAIIKLYEDENLRHRLAARGREYVERAISRRVVTSVYCRLISDMTCCDK